MVVFGTCPRCGSQIDKERLKNSPLVCDSCGWVNSDQVAEKNQSITKAYIMVIGSLSLFMVAAFMLAVNWDNHGVEILRLKPRQYLGVASTVQLQRIAEICKERGKLDCMEEALHEAVEKEPLNDEIVIEYAKTVLQTKNYQEGQRLLGQYFNQGGQELEAAYLFAQILGHQGRVNDAVMYYNSVLAAKPDVLQVTVTKNLVDLLVHDNRLEEAQKLIKKTRKQAGRPGAYFMSAELNQIEKKLKATL